MMIAPAVDHPFPDVEIERRVDQLLADGYALPISRWPLLGSYNGATGAERRAGSQKFQIACEKTWIIPEEACSICGATGSLGHHNENYFRPLAAKRVCRSCHGKIHRRYRHPDRWREFVEQRGGEGWYAFIAPRELTRAEAIILARQPDPSAFDPRRNGV
ncbi:hypothetical protein [Rhizorhabdus argentea]|uniref:hypothetical protein n=1 Tax=Rhizorhabdus argentea TaxID=1387174 RepID=UPI0030EDD42E